MRNFNMKDKLFFLSLIGASLLSLFFPTGPDVGLAFLPALIGGIVSLGAGMMGHIGQMSAQERAAMLQEKGMQEWFKINIPDPEQQKLALERFVQVGELTPELESAFKLAQSEMENIERDPRLKDARLRALSSLEEMGYGGELVSDAAAQQKTLIESGARSRGQQGAITGAMARRGQLGSGLELTARQNAAQAEGDRLATEGLDLESNRRDRALKAIMGAGDLAGNLEEFEYKVDSDKAKARDTISAFNTQNMQSVSNRNVDRNNRAQEYNLNQAQTTADQNVGLANYEHQYNKELAQQKFQNEAAKAAGVSGQYNQQAETAIAEGKSAADMWGNIAKGAGTAALGLSKAKKDTPDKLTWAGDDLDDEYWRNLA